MKRIQVKVLCYPISDRYCSVGASATLDLTTSQVRVGGAWFDFDDRWSVEFTGEKK
jgi:hypothetical protein